MSDAVRGRPHEPAKPFLEVVKGLNPGVHYRLDKPVVILGRHPEADISIPQRQISDRHCRLIVDSTQVCVEDLGSTNGTVVNGKAIFGSVPIGPTTRLEIGHTVFRIVKRREDEIRAEEKWLEGATTDLLTGIPNQHMFRRMADILVALAKRKRWWGSLLMIDTDHLYDITAAHGLSVGDEALYEIAQVLARGKRTEDLLARFGEETFVLLLLDTPPEGAAGLAERLRITAAARRIRHAEHVIPLRISIGVASCRERNLLHLNHLLAAADDALYQAKLAGGNQVCSAPEDPSTETDTQIHS